MFRALIAVALGGPLAATTAWARPGDAPHLAAAPMPAWEVRPASLVDPDAGPFATPAFAAPGRVHDPATAPSLSQSLAAVAPAPLPQRKPSRGVVSRGSTGSGGPSVLSPFRAQVLLRSLTLPGWGQATAGRRTAATVFGAAELGVWATYTAFRIQERMRRDTYERTARLSAGIDLEERDEEYRRIVGSFLSSDEYNLLVVYRDAANLYYDDPVQYQLYIERNQLRGDDVWAWQDVEGLLRYRGQRKDAQRAALRANAALAAAIVNRLLSAVHAARVGIPPASNAWRLEVEPTDDGDATALRVGVSRRF